MNNLSVTKLFNLISKLLFSFILSPWLWLWGYLIFSIVIDYWQTANSLSEIQNNRTIFHVLTIISIQIVLHYLWVRYINNFILANLIVLAGFLQVLTISSILLLK